MNPAEAWKPIPGFVGAYEISNLGRVRSIPGGRRRGQVLKPGRVGRYLGVSLCLDGSVTRFYVHHLVALMFIGLRPDGLDICHNNGDRFDNRAENLRYDTRHANMRDAVAQGRHPETWRTHCDHGHEFTADNTLLWTSLSADGRGMKSRRVCRECHRLRSERWNERVRQRRALAGV